MNWKHAWRVGLGSFFFVVVMLVGSLGAKAQVATSNSSAMEKEFGYEQSLMSAKPFGPAGQPWAQYLDNHMVDTAQYKKAPPYNVCVSNASLSNPWRVLGWKIMQATAEKHKPLIASAVVLGCTRHR